MNYFRASFRLILFLAVTLLLYVSWWIGSLVIPNKQYWRQVTFHTWARVFAAIAGMKVEIIGTPPRPPFFLVSNHLSYVDIPVLRFAVDGVFVAKSDIRDWFLAGPIVANMGNIFINRQNRRDIPRAGREIIEKWEQNEGVILFPEGTSTKGEDVLPFNSSFLEFAAKADLPVSYASISYQTPSGGPAPSERICWWDDTGFAKHMWRLFSLKEFTAVINFGDEPIINTDRKQLANDLRRRVKEKFIPMM